MTTCKITSLGDAQKNPFRKKRSPDDVIEQMPVLKVDNEIIPFKVRFSRNILCLKSSINMYWISGTRRVFRTAWTWPKYSTLKGKYILNNLSQVFWPITSFDIWKHFQVRHPRLLTVIATKTVTQNLTLTITTTPLEVEELFFTSSAANHCLPFQIVATMPTCL